VQVAAAHQSTAVIRGWFGRNRGAVCIGIAVALASAGGLALLSGSGLAIAAALSGFGFATLHLLSPVSPEAWLNPLPGWLGVVGLLAAILSVLAAWRLVERTVPAFAAFLLVAALLPVSSMTEGSRYLYFASVPVAMFAAWAISAMRPRMAALGYTLLALALIVFGWQVRAKGRDWLWASGMTTRAVATIVDAAGPGCRGADIVFATAPVRTHGVYANINHEALAALGNCRPAGLRTIIRTGYDDPAIDATLVDSQLVLRVASYRGGFITSPDFQRYSRRLDAGTATRLTNGLGAFEAVPDGPDLVIRQQLRPGATALTRWFVFASGSVRRLSAPR
jgi:hypothetical protein